MKKNIKEQVDKLLEEDSIMYTNLGVDSTSIEKLEVKKKSERIYRKIQKLDYDMGSSLLRAMDVNPEPNGPKNSD